MEEGLKELRATRPETVARPTKASPDFRAILAAAPEVHEVLARPMVYEAWLKKAQEALNG